jgi:hypothetical protein
MLDSMPFDPEKLSMIDFRMLAGQINAPDDFDNASVNDFNIENSLEFRLNSEKKLFRTDFTIEITTHITDANPIPAIGKFQFAYVFDYVDYDSIFDKSNPDQAQIEEALLSSISAVSYSTSRGVLLTRIQGTALQGFILPIIDAAKLLPKKEV